MPNTSGINNRRKRSPMNEPVVLLFNIKYVTVPEIKNNSGILNLPSQKLTSMSRLLVSLFLMCHPHSSTYAMLECRKKTIKIERIRSQSKYAWRVETGCIRLILYKPSRPVPACEITLTCGRFG